MNRIKFMSILSMGILSACSSSYKGPPSDHFDGKKFFNPGLGPEKGFFDLLKWQIFGERKPWPKFVDDVSPVKVSPPKEGHYKVTFINHATLLIQIGDLNILTDPLWSDRTSPVSFVGPKRKRIPGINFEDLPRIDIVLISHNHYDHLDIESLIKIARVHKARFLVPLGDKALLESAGISNVEELDWGESRTFSKVRINFEKAAHWSGRGIADRYHSLWGSHVIEFEKVKIYFAGDTGYHTHFKEIGAKYGAMSLALLPIGAYEPRWFMKQAHMNPADAVMAFEDLKASAAIGMHFGTFQLTDEGINDPKEDLKKALDEQGLSLDRFHVPFNGQVFEFKL